MHVTGTELRDAIHRRELRLDANLQEYADSLYKYDNEDKPSPLSVFEKIDAEELAIAQLQTVQTRFNLSVTVEVGGKRISLCEAVKSVGGAGRNEKRWRAVITKDSQRNAFTDRNTRDPNMQFAKKQVTPEDALRLADYHAQRASTLRNVIALGNAQKIDLDFDANLLK